jgi:cytochrome c-type biogenesis protein CcmE
MGQHLASEYDRIPIKQALRTRSIGEKLVKTKAKFAIGAGIIIVTLSCLAWVGAEQSKTYYHTISEIPSLTGTALHQRLRVGGDVKEGSIQHYSGRIDFVLVEEGKALPVSYVGTDPLPDTFKDGAQCLVEGKVQPDGRFVAETVQAKCASKYEAAPAGVTTPGAAPADSYSGGKS